MPPDIPDDYALYLRKSNGRKAVPRQRSITTGHVEAAGGRIAREFTDTDKTAFRKVGGEQPERKGFAAMLAALQANPGLGVAAWHADRLTRNDEDTAALIRVCAAGGHLVVTPSGGAYDLGTANGRKRLRDDASAAIYEVDHGRERIMAARAEVAADGRWLGGKRPFGWELDRNPAGEDGEPMLDEDGEPVRGILRLRQPEAAALARAHLDILAGATLAGIARRWNAQGILTTEGKQWHPREAGRVLRRPRNAGLMEHRGAITGPARWPPVVDEATWRGVAAILADPGRRTTPGPASRHLLSWIARCGVCGGPVICTSSSRSSGGGRRLVYRCREGTRGHLSRDQGHLDALVAALVIGRLSRADAAGLLVKPAAEGGMVPLMREMAAIREMMAADRRLHLAGVITEAEFAAGRRKHQADLAATGERIAVTARADVLAPMIGDPAGVWEGMDLDQRRAVISRLMTVRLMPAPKGRPAGWRPGEPYFDPRSVEVTWNG